MSVLVLPYDPAWPEQAARAAAGLQDVLARWLVGAVEHIGSTAVPGLSAKPVLDLLAPVADLEDARAAVPVLEGCGWRHAEHRPHEALWFYLQPGEEYATRTQQLHLTEPGSALWRERLAFRDALRADPTLRDEYAALKERLGAGSADLAGYNAGKRPLIAAALERAGVPLQAR